MVVCGRSRWEKSILSRTILFAVLCATLADDLCPFECKTMLPKGIFRVEADTWQTPNPLAVMIGENLVEAVQYTPGKRVRVLFRLSGSSFVTAFFCRTSPVSLSNPIGRWSVTDTATLTPFTCYQTGDTLLFNATKLLDHDISLAAYWNPPSEGLGEAEIVCSILNVKAQVWIWTSMLLEQASDQK